MGGLGTGVSKGWLKSESRASKMQTAKSYRAGQLRGRLNPNMLQNTRLGNRER